MKINIEFELEEINRQGNMTEPELKEQLIGYIDSLLIHDRDFNDDTSVLWAIDNKGYVHTFKISIIDGKD